MHAPLILGPSDLLAYDEALDWLQRDYPSVTLGPPETMMQILSQCWSTDEVVIWEKVIDRLYIPDEWTVMVRNVWLFHLNLSLPEYVLCVRHDSLPDSLVILLAVSFFDTHLAIAHGSGIWSSRSGGISQLGDLLIITSDSSLCQAVLRECRSSIQRNFAAWTDILPVIRAKINDVLEAKRLSGYQPKPNAAPSPLLIILADLFHMETDVYRTMIMVWMEEHVQHHASVMAWWETHGQDWTYYKTIL